MYTGFSILLIAAGITAGKTILGKSQFFKPLITDKPAKRTAKPAVRLSAATKNSPVASPSEPVQKNMTEEIPFPSPEKAVQGINNRKTSVLKTSRFKPVSQLPAPKVQDVGKNDSAANRNPEDGLNKTLVLEEETKKSSKKQYPVIGYCIS